MTQPTVPPVILADTDQARQEACDDLVLAGWRIAPGWTVPDPADVVLSGEVSDREQLGEVVLAVIGGAGAVAAVRDPGLAQRLYDDLRRVVSVTHRSVASGWVVLPREESRLLDLLAEGASIAEAAGGLHLARRTVDRRLAAARRRLGVSTTGAAVAVRRRRLEALPRPR